MKIINVPNLNHKNALMLCHVLQHLDYNSDYILDFADTHAYDPFPMLIVSASICKARSRHQGKLMVQASDLACNLLLMKKNVIAIIRSSISAGL